MAEDTLKHGQRRAMRLRRIDDTRLIILPAQAAEVVDVRQLQRQLLQAMQLQARLEQQLARAKDSVVALRSVLETFQASPAQPHEDDPPSSAQAPAPEEPAPTE